MTTRQAPTHLPAGHLDELYRPAVRTLTPAERRSWLIATIEGSEARAVELEASADRWSTMGDADTAARNLADARTCRTEAEEWRAALAELDAPAVSGRDMFNRTAAEADADNWAEPSDMGAQ